MALDSITERILRDFDFYINKIDTLHDFLNDYKLMTDTDEMIISGQPCDPKEYLVRENEDMQQGFDRLRREIEITMRILRQIARNTKDIRWEDY